MKINILLKLTLILFVVIGIFAAFSLRGYISDYFNNTQDKSQPTQEAHIHNSEKETNTVHLSALEFNRLGMKVDAIPTRILSGIVKANGWLELFPQHKAVVKAVVGANITEIKVIEGEKVKKDQILAYLSHPNLMSLQRAYIKSYNQMQFLAQEYNRQERLYNEKIISGEIYQQTKADYQTTQSEVKGYKAQLKQLNIDIKRIEGGNIVQYVPILSPIDGYVKKIWVQTGQYVDPKAQILNIINNDFIHANLMVFEKDAHKIKEGQKVLFKVGSVQEKILSAIIFSVEKNFERNPRVIRVHAEIDQKEFSLIPGMPIQGKIYMENKLVNALPEEAIVIENGKSYIFLVENNETEWLFTPVEIRTGILDEGWVEIKLLESLTQRTQVAWNNAYYLIAQMKKSETSHEH